MFIASRSPLSRGQVSRGRARIPAYAGMTRRSVTKLEQLEEELYAKDDEAEEKLEKRLRKRMRLPGTLKRLPIAWRADKPAIAQEGASLSQVLKIFIGALIIFLIVGGAAFIFFFLSTRGQEARIAILGRDEIESAERFTIPVAFKNISTAALREVELAVILPKDAVIFEEGLERPAPPRYIVKIGDLVPEEERTVEIQARFLGSEGEEKEIEAILLYRPENLRAKFSSRATKIVRISRVPLAISWEVPETLSRGQEVEVKLFYSSSARTPFPNISLRLDYPPGFTFSSASPEPSDGDYIWDLGTLNPGDGGVIAIRGTITGEEAEIKAFRAGLGEFNPATQEWRSFAEASREIKIAVTPLAVQGFLSERDQFITPGERPSFSVRYRNNTQFIIRNVTVRAFLSGEILNYSTLDVSKGGVFDERTQAIVWGPANVPELRELSPGAEGEFAFSITTRKQPRVASPQDKNLLVTLRTEIETVSPPPELTGTDLASEDVLEVKVRSIILFSGKSLQRSSPIQNSGPLPPKVGSKTTYTISWEIRNFTNDLEDAEVRATIPPNVLWENKIFPADARISYDAASGEAVWRIGEIKAGVGVFTPALVASFQVSVVPALVDVGRSPTLLNESVFRARDTFTGEDREIKIDALTTELRQDPLTNSTHWMVAD